MAVIVDLPPDIEQRLRAETCDLDREATVATLVQLYREERLARHELSQVLGLNRFETDALLKQHLVTEDLPPLEELEEDFRLAKRMLER